MMTSRLVRLAPAVLLAFACAGVPAVFAQTAAAPTTQASSVSGQDKEFAKEAAGGNLFEVALAQVALQKSTDEGVKQFAQSMVDDHTKANTALSTAAAAAGVTVPTDVSHKKQKELDKFSKLSGAEFDQHYVHYMVKDHANDVKEYQTEINKGKNDDLKNYATETLPVIQHHLEMVKALDQKTGGKTASDK